MLSRRERMYKKTHYQRILEERERNETRWRVRNKELKADGGREAEEINGEGQDFSLYIPLGQGDRLLGRIVPECNGINSIRNEHYIMFPCRFHPQELYPQSQNADGDERGW